MSRYNYQRVNADQVPSGLRFDVPRYNQGQIVEVAYGDSARDHSEHGPGAPWKRVTDASDRSIEYYRLVVS